jgi:hypothetical protein
MKDSKMKDYKKKQWRPPSKKNKGGGEKPNTRTTLPGSSDIV